MQTFIDGTELGVDHDLVRYDPTFLEGNVDRYYNSLVKLYNLAKKEKGLFGNPSLRRTLQVGDKGIRPYKYSGASADTVHEWDEYKEVKEIKERIEDVLGVTFNLALLNFYEPEAVLGFHQDKEEDMVDQAVIASISLGSVRRFRLRELPPGTTSKKKGVWPKGEKAKEWKPMLAHGSLITMEGDCQKLLEHSIPKMVVSKADMEKFKGMRINITFRQMRDM